MYLLLVFKKMTNKNNWNYIIIIFGQELAKILER